MEVTLVDICLRKVLEEKLSKEFVKHILTVMINPEKLTFPTLKLIYEIYGKLEDFRYPDWFCENCGVCSDCDSDNDNPTDFAAAAMGWRKIRVYYDDLGYSTDEYTEDSD